ncbi:ATP-dependent DNA helicase MPH1 [Frankliniella fusca]|uniref:ATP-dependent DNA helicase MPH1 n=1 Tax=Frankliniella fusca TaxID=407009 RepID=A0AAE1HRA3_9NEOP|nr:ATP-dependent DNA helicase MPH1 [Frankliniella fusca]
MKYIRLCCGLGTIHCAAHRAALTRSCSPPPRWAPPPWTRGPRPSSCIRPEDRKERGEEFKERSALAGALAEEFNVDTGHSAAWGRVETSGFSVSSDLTAPFQLRIRLRFWFRISSNPPEDP